MYANLSFGQSTYLSQSSRRIFGLEAMAIIFSLPWALLLWSYVISQAITFTLFMESFRFPDRMVTFSVALLLLCFVVSNVWTQLFVASTSFPLLTFTFWCLWMCWDSSCDTGTVPAHPEFIFNVVKLLRIPVRPASTFLASDDGSSRHSPSTSQGDVSGV
jgi:hypothetical protein